jgi:hypothetical protein
VCSCCQTFRERQIGKRVQAHTACASNNITHRIRPMSSHSSSLRVSRDQGSDRDLANSLRWCRRALFQAIRRVRGRHPRDDPLSVNGGGNGATTGQPGASSGGTCFASPATASAPGNSMAAPGAVFNPNDQAPHPPTPRLGEPPHRHLGTHRSLRRVAPPEGAAYLHTGLGSA